MADLVEKVYRKHLFQPHGLMTITEFRTAIIELEARQIEALRAIAEARKRRTL